MFLLQKITTITLILILTLGEKYKRDVLLYDLVFRILHAHLRLNYIHFSLALTVLTEFNAPL